MSTITSSRTCTIWGALALCASAILTTGCGSGEEESGGTLLPHQSPVAFGELYPLGDQSPNVANISRVPYEWVLRLQAREGSVIIEDVCLVGDTDPFILEGAAARFGPRRARSGRRGPPDLRAR